MSKQIELEAKKREELGKKVKKLKAQGLIPAVVYGRKFKATPVSVGRFEFNKKVLESEAGLNLIFNLKLSEDGKSTSLPVITSHLQRNPLNDEIIHIDFKHVIMDEEIKTKVPVELIGLPIGVKDEGGVLVHGLREIEVKCLPADIPDKFELDVSELKINQSLHVSDLKVSEKIEILASETEMVATVSPPTKEEEIAPPPPTPEELAAAEALPAVAEEEVKGKIPPGAAPGKAAPAAEAGKAEKPPAGEKK